jgi:hypothetical protein
MSENRRGHWRVQIVDVPYLPAANKNGVHYGIQFTNGFAYVNWKTLGEEESYNAIQRLGSDERFSVVEIPEKDYQPFGSK